MLNLNHAHYLFFKCKNKLFRVVDNVYALKTKYFKSLLYFKIVIKL